MCDEDEYSDEQIQDMKAKVAFDAGVRIMKGSERVAAISGALGHHHAVQDSFAEAMGRDGVFDSSDAYLDKSDDKPYDPAKLTASEKKQASAIAKEIIDLIDDDDVK